MRNLQEQLEQFYAWEYLGRGHLIWDEPVRLEPPFKPFKRKTFSSHQQPVDDGQSEGILSFLWNNFRRTHEGGGDSEESEATPVNEEEETPSLNLDESSEPIIEIQVLLPESTAISPGLAEQFLRSLDQCQEPIAFEIIGKPDAILIQFAVRPIDAGLIQSQLEAHFPSATILSVSACALTQWDEDQPSLILEFGFTKEFMLPLRDVSSFAQDPIVSIAGAMSSLMDGEISVLQVLIEPLRHPWGLNIERSITQEDGSPFFNDDREFTSACRQKLTHPLYAVVCRIGVQAAEYDRVIHLATNIASSLSMLNHQGGNELVALDNDAYNLDEHRADLLQRKSRRSGMIWNSSELISVVHLPNNTVRIPKLRREGGKTKRAPEIAMGHSLILGENLHAEVSREVSLSDQQRARHMHLIGTSGSGKSTLLFNMICQDIQAGNGCAILDPHGDLVDQIIQIIPEHRMDDVILFDPSDAEFPIGFNILEAHTELEKNLLASDLVSVFKRLTTSWGDQMGAVLHNAILAFLENPKGGTLYDLRRFLVEPDFRNEYLKTVQDIDVVYYWKKEFTMLSGRPQAPLLTRLNTFLGTKTIRYMVSQREKNINFSDVMDGRKIFLAKLSKGLLGTDNSYLLGTLLVAKFYQIAMSRQAIDAALRHPFYLYIDEFHNFICSSMSSILTESRKYGLGLVLAHQEMKQIESRDTDVAGSLIANPQVRVCFRLGDEDARKLAKGFSYFEEKDLQNLGVGEAICRLEKSEYDFNLKVPKPEVSKEDTESPLNRIRQRTRALHATPRTVMEEQLRKEHASLFEEEEPPKAKSKPNSKEQSQSSDPPKTKSHQPESVKKEQLKSEAPDLKSDQKGTDVPGKQSEEPSCQPSTLPCKTQDQKTELPTSESQRPPKHEEIKEYLITEAEKLNYKVDREVLVLDGNGRIDLVFTRGQLKIACEIANTTTDGHEVGNITKCIEAEFTMITVVSALPERLKRIAELFRHTITDIKPDVDFKSPEAFVEILGRFAKADPAGGEVEKSKPTKQQFDFKGSEQSEEAKKQKEKDLIDQLKKNLKKK
jgi:hypothetical protein